VKNEIVLYQPDSTVRLEVMLGDDTVWLSVPQMADLFGRDVSTIRRHIYSAKEEELAGFCISAKFARIQKEPDGITRTRQVEHFNLDAILSVGYRVKSTEGIRFRQWANSVLKDFLLRGYAINQRFERLEEKVGNIDGEIRTVKGEVKDVQSQVEFFVRTALPPIEGVLFEGQIF
jgi:hypothetical protein